MHRGIGILHVLSHVRSAIDLAMHLVDVEDEIVSGRYAGKGDTKASCEGIFPPYDASRVGGPLQVSHRAFTLLVWHDSLCGVCMVWGGHYSGLLLLNQGRLGPPSLDVRSHPLQRQSPMRVRRGQSMVSC